MATANATLTATIAAKDEASPTLKLVAATMQDLDAKTRQASSGGVANMDAQLQRMPEKMSRFAGGLSVISNAAGGMGKGISEAAGKATFLASTIAQGGPLGIATAAITVAVAAGAAVWRVYSDQSQIVKGAIASLDPVMKGISDRLKEQSNTTRALTDELRFYGMASRDVAIAKAQEALALKSNLPSLKSQIAADEQALALKRKEIEAIDTGSVALGFINTLRVKEKSAKVEEYNADVAMLNIRKQSITASEQDAGQLKQQIELLGRLKVADAGAKAEKKSHTKAIQEESAEIAQARREIEQWEDAEQAFYDRRHKEQAQQLGLMARGFKAQSGYYDKLADLQEESAKQQEADDKKRYQMGLQVMNGLTSAGVAYAQGQMSGSEAAKTAARQTGVAVINAAAAEGAAKAMAAYAGIPGIGIALGIAAAASIATMILGYLTKFHTGGVVGSNDGVRLPGMAPNERMVNVMVGEPIGMVRQSGSPVGGVTNNFNMRPLFAPTAADTKRMVNQVSKMQRRQRALGHA